MKHIGQSSEKHTTGPFNITEDMPSLTSGTNLRAISSLPQGNSLEKLFPVCQCADPGDLKENIPQPSAVCRSWRDATPGQALPLNMDQAALNHHFRPEITKYFHHVRIPIYRKAMRVQSGLFQTLKEFQQLGFGIFWHIVTTGYERVCFSIHKGNKAERTVQVSPIKDKVLTLLQVQHRPWYWVSQLTINHFIKLSHAGFGLFYQLPYRVAFNNPEPERLLLFEKSAFFVTPSIGAPTESTKPPLFSFSIVPILFENF
jgi:hypothetical protein